MPMSPKGPKYHGPKQKHKRTREEERDRERGEREKLICPLISLTPRVIDNHPPSPCAAAAAAAAPSRPLAVHPSPAISAAQHPSPPLPIRFFHGKIAEIPQKIRRNPLRSHFLNKSHGYFRSPAQPPHPSRGRRRRRSHQTISAPPPGQPPPPRGPNLRSCREDQARGLLLLARRGTRE